MTETLVHPAEAPVEAYADFRDAFRRYAGIDPHVRADTSQSVAAHGREALAVFDAIVDQWIVNAATAEGASFYWALKQMGRDILCLHLDSAFEYEGSYRDEDGLHRVLNFALPTADGGYRCLTLCAENHQQISGTASAMDADEDEAIVGDQADGAPAMNSLHTDQAEVAEYVGKLWGIYRPRPARAPQHQD